jgi:AbrB-like transcriptional regulator
VHNETNIQLITIVAKTKVESAPKAPKSTATKTAPSVTKADKSAKVAATTEETTEASSAATPLTGKALLQKVKELAHLAKRETAKECGYIKTSTSGGVRTDLSGFYDAVLAAKGVKLDETSRDSRGKVATYKATVHKNGQLLIGSAYTKGMGLKEGDVFTIKLGYKHIHLIQDN